ncbi:MAG: CHRD domain-containing protein [Vicinamibacteraceae bacterium]
MRVRSCLVGVLACLVLSTASAQAAPITFGAFLTADQEIPAPDIPSGFLPFGVAGALFDTDTNELLVGLGWLGLTSPAVIAHIHRADPTTMVGPPIIDFGALPALTSGMLFLPLTLTQMQATALIDGLRDGSLYFNVHTTRNPAGEIRGNIGKVDVPTTPAPEPATLALFGIGLIAIGLIRRRLTA